MPPGCYDDERISMALVRGIDISSAQSITSWASVAKAVDFVIVKATEGRTFSSPTWPAYYKDSKAAKILTGSYHYAHPRNNPVSEAEHYIAALKAAGFRSGFDLPPVLDLEETEGRSKAALTLWAINFMHEVDSAFSLTKPWQKTGVYLNPNYFHNLTDGPKVVDGRWKWLADWPKRDSVWPPDSGLPRSSAAVWQFTDRMRIPGIKQNVDGDVARLVDLHDLAPMFYGVKPPPVPVPPKPPVPLVLVDRRMVARNATQTGALQRALNTAVGSNVHGGFHDRATIAAIRAWQKRLKQPETGWLTQAQFEKLATTTRRFVAKKETK
jgi:GH25 family lysozyme M1 (1,4-beta-N-acetylmuramidase)